MNVFQDAMLKTAEAAKDDGITREIISYAAEGMWPFRIGRVRLGLDYSIDTMNRNLWLEIEALPDDAFEMMIDERRMYGDPSPETYLLETVRGPIIEHFRYRTQVVPDDHIVLGEG